MGYHKVLPKSQATLKRPIKTYRKGRVCKFPLCETILSIYNGDPDFCNMHFCDGDYLRTNVEGRR